MADDFVAEIRRKKDAVSTLTNYLKHFIGVPYKYGGSNPISGFDCSGLIIEGLQSVGFLPHKSDYTAQSLYNYLIMDNRAASPISISEGCLVFFGKTKDSIGHIGYAIHPKFMIEAGGGDSHTIDKASAEAKDAFVKIRPIYYRKDYLCALIPNY